MVPQLGVVGLSVIALMTNHCCQLIVKCKNVAVSTLLESSPHYQELVNEGCHQELAKLKEKIEKEMTLGDIGKVAVGQWGVRIVNFALVLTQTGFCVSYFIFMGQTIKDMFPGNLKSVNITSNNNTPYHLQDGNMQNSSSMVPPIIINSTAPAFLFLVLIPMPVIVIMAFIRDIRKLGPVSGIANVAILAGFITFLVYMLNGKYRGTPLL